MLRGWRGRGNDAEGMSLLVVLGRCVWRVEGVCMVGLGACDCIAWIWTWEAIWLFSISTSCNIPYCR